MTPTEASQHGVRPVTLRYWAGARAAAGVSEETLVAGPLVGDVLDGAVDAHPALREVVAVCSVLVDGRSVGFATSRYRGHGPANDAPSGGVMEGCRRDALEPVASARRRRAAREHDAKTLC